MTSNPSTARSGGPALLAIAGSLRQHSFNKAVVRHAAATAEAAGARVTVVELNDLDLPLFSEDLELGQVSPGATRLKGLMSAADGFFDRQPRVQRLGQWGAQKRHRLGEPPGPG